MSRDTDNSLFIDSSMRRFYQQLVSGIGSYRELGNRIISRIKAAHAFRQVDHVRELSKLLINLPIREYRVIAQYYLAWCDCRELRFDATALERIVEQTQTYKTQALFSRGAIDWYLGNNEQAMYFYVEALKTSPSLSEYVDLMRTIAVLKSREGFHESALRDMEGLTPVLRHVEPRLYYDYLNSYAVELGEAGRKNEARNISRIVLASPFIHAYPEWQETAQELKEPNRAFISVPSIEREPVEIEAPAKVLSIESHPDFESEEPAKVISFPELKEAPRPNMPKLLKSQELEYMNVAERRELIMAAIKSGGVPEGQYKRVIYLLGLVESGPANQILDLEDAALLSKIIMNWCNLIEPEHTAVMSALRDCKDDLRRQDIIDKMITVAYQQTASGTDSEHEWRWKVECRLPEK